MKALISGQAGVAVLFDGECVSSLRVGSPVEVPLSESEILCVLGDASDLAQLDEINRDAAATELELAWRKDRSLHLALILLDGEADREARQLSTECLQEFIGDPNVLEFILDRLYSAPLPLRADLLGALLLAERVRAAAVVSFLEDLGEHQAEIERCREAWDLLSADRFGGPETKAQFGYALATAGAFRQLAKAEPEEKNNVVVRYLTNPEIRSFRDYRSIVMAWTEPFRVASRVQRPGHELEDTERESFVEYRGKRVEGPRRDSRILEIVNKQKDAIKKLLSQGDTTRALRFVEELIEYQRGRSEDEHLAKSLCDLAQFAKGIGDNKLQMEFAYRAVGIAPTDGWSQAQLGDAYLRLGKYREALEAYE
ncbi:MAG: hypothetical protein HY237_15305, partial [Acidobacteria bacterium]|nr:hypothetical protein [Acidobacteriota bacterium]